MYDFSGDHVPVNIAKHVSPAARWQMELRQQFRGNAFTVASRRRSKSRPPEPQSSNQIGSQQPELVNGSAALSPEMALRVEKAFGVDMEMMLRMQAWHDANAMRSRAGEIDVKRYQPSPEPR